MVTRIRELLVRPQNEMAVIRSEAATVGDLYAGFAVLVYPVPGAFLLLGLSIAGVDLFPALLGALLYASLSLAALAGFAGLAGWLIPRFGGRRGRLAAQQLSVYGLVPFALGGVALAIPGPLGYWLALIAGAYSYWVLYGGLVALAGVPRERVVPLLVVLSLASLLLFFGVQEAAFRLTGALSGR